MGLGPPRVAPGQALRFRVRNLVDGEKSGSRRNHQNRPRLIQELIQGDYSGGLSSHAGRTESRESNESQAVRKAIPGVRVIAEWFVALDESHSHTVEVTGSSPVPPT